VGVFIRGNVTDLLIWSTRNIRRGTETRAGHSGATDDLVEIIAAQRPIRAGSPDARTILPVFDLDILVGMLFIPSLLELVSGRHTMSVESIASRG
jgi:hypothetical protein